MNYTKQQADYIVGTYVSAMDKQQAVQELSKELNKSTKSIIGKLSREGVYRRTTYISKTGLPPITKVELVRSIAANLELEEEKLEGLEKSPKQVLFLLEKATGL